MTPQHNFCTLWTALLLPTRTLIFLYLFVSEFQALQSLVQATPQWEPSDILMSTHPHENLPHHTNYSNPTAVINRVYPSISAPICTETWNRRLTLLPPLQQSYQILAISFVMPFQRVSAFKILHVVLWFPIPAFSACFRAIHRDGLQHLNPHVSMFTAVSSRIIVFLRYVSISEIRVYLNVSFPALFLYPISYYLSTYCFLVVVVLLFQVVFQFS